MQGKSFVFALGVLLILLFTGGYLVYKSASKNDSSEVNDENLTSNKYERINEKGQNISKNTRKGTVEKQSTSSKNKSDNDLSNGVNNKLSPNEKIVDQIIPSLNKAEEKVVPINKVLGSAKEKVDFEILLKDGDQNKIITNYEVEFKYSFNNEPIKSEKFKTNNEGKIIFSPNKPGYLSFRIISRDYAIHTKQYQEVSYGKNNYQANLFKGGSIEVRATNAEKKVVVDLTAKLIDTFRSFQSQESIPLELDEKRGVYVLSNVPMGAQDISFKAPGYFETGIFKIKFDSKKIAFIEIKFQLIRKLIFDIEAKTKPNLIYIYNGKIGRDFMRYYMLGGKDNPSSVTYSSNPQPINRPSAEVKDFFSGHAEVYKNQNNLYEFELESKNVSVLSIYADKYAPQEIKIVADKDTYKLKLIEGYSSQVQVNNEEGKGVKDARISYNVGAFKYVFKTGEDGIALLTGLEEQINFYIDVQHEDYLIYREYWSFDAKRQENKIIVMKEGKNISGKIKFGEQIVMGSQVFLFQSDQINYPVLRMESDANGNYSFNNFLVLKDKSYTIQAYHHEFGVAISSTISFENKNQIIDLTLIEEKSLSLKLVDNKGDPIPNKKINFSSNIGAPSNLNILTNEKGEHEFLNMIHGNYRIKLEDNNLKINPSSILIPAGVVVVTAIAPEQNELIKIEITAPDGKPFKGIFKVYFERGYRLPMEVITGEDSNYYVNVPKDQNMLYGKFLFEVPDCAEVRLGPYLKIEELPKEFKVELQAGDNIKVKVIDDQNKPLPFIQVDILVDNICIESLPTNELGEIIFNHLKGKFFVTVKADNFAPYQNEFEGAQAKEILVKLIKGGGLKVHMSVGKEIPWAIVYLQNINPSQKSSGELDAEGNFEFFNLIPGEYTLQVRKIFKDGKSKSDNIPTKIIIENEKFFEINLDDYLKSHMSLDVSVYKDGVLSNEVGYLHIQDLHRQAVSSATINNGRHLIESILPGDYFIHYAYQGKFLIKSLSVLPHQSNSTEIYVFNSNLAFGVKNEDGGVVPKAMITVYAGDKFRQEYSYLGTQMVTDKNGSKTFQLMAKTPYYIIVEEDFLSNFQVKVVGPIILEEGQTTKIECVLPYGRKLPNIQVVDNVGNPIADAAFICKDENGNIQQRTLKPEWDLFPFSNKNGLLPENGWPKGSFSLIVGKEGYEFREVLIATDMDPLQPVQIILQKPSSIKCNFPQALIMPISVSLLDQNGLIIQRPIPLSNRKKNELTTYFDNITNGSVTFSDLTAGTYYIGYYWNGSNRLISKSAPIKLGVEENQTITSTLVLSEN